MTHNVTQVREQEGVVLTGDYDVLYVRDVGDDLGRAIVNSTGILVRVLDNSPDIAIYEDDMVALLVLITENVDPSILDAAGLRVID